jgi:hypothetical protein
VSRRWSTYGWALAAAAALIALPAAAAPPAASADGVLIVGDSLDVGAEPYIRAELPGLPVTVDARVGRPSTEGVGVLQSLISSRYSVVVFDLGTNDSPSATQTLANNLETARGIAGPQRCFVVSTLWRPPYAGVSIDHQNRVIQGFLERYPDVRVADWRAVAQYYPNLFAPDHIHASTVGYHLRAGLIARAVQSCPTSTQQPSTYSAPAAPPIQEPRPQPPFDLARFGLARPSAALRAMVSAAWYVVTGVAVRVDDHLDSLP